MESIGIVILLIWLGLAWWGAALARSRGRSAVTGAVLGGALGLIGVFIVWLLPVDHEALRREEERRIGFR